MSIQLHHAIVVTSDNKTELDRVYGHARLIFDIISSIITSSHNDCRSFYIPPDGGNQGQNRSNQGDKQRDAFIGFLSQYPTVCWVEVQFGSDAEQFDNKMTRCSGDKSYNHESESRSKPIERVEED